MKFMRNFSEGIICSMSYIGFMKAMQSLNLPDWVDFGLFLLAGTAYIFWLASEND